MSSNANLTALELTAERVLGEKAQQATAHSLLEDCISELECELRTNTFLVKDEVQAIERKRQELIEVCEESNRVYRDFVLAKVRHDAQLALHAKTMDQLDKAASRSEEALSTWRVVPPQLVSTLRLLQERKAAKLERQKLAEIINEGLRAWTIQQVKEIVVEAASATHAALPELQRAHAECVSRVEVLEDECAAEDRTAHEAAQEQALLKTRIGSLQKETEANVIATKELDVANARDEEALARKHEALKAKQAELADLQAEERKTAERRAQLHTEELDKTQQLAAFHREAQSAKQLREDRLAEVLRSVREAEERQSALQLRLDEVLNSLTNTEAGIQKNRHNIAFVIDTMNQILSEKIEWRRQENALESQLAKVEEQLQELKERERKQDEDARRARLVKHLEVRIEAAEAEESLTRQSSIEQEELESFDAILKYWRVAEDAMRVLLLNQKKLKVVEHDEETLRENITKHECNHFRELCDLMVTQTPKKKGKPAGHHPSNTQTTSTTIEQRNATNKHYSGFLVDVVVPAQTQVNQDFVYGKRLRNAPQTPPPRPPTPNKGTTNRLSKLGASPMTPQIHQHGKIGEQSSRSSKKKHSSQPPLEEEPSQSTNTTQSTVVGDLILRPTNHCSQQQQRSSQRGGGNEVSSRRRQRGEDHSQQQHQRCAVEVSAHSSPASNDGEAPDSQQQTPTAAAQSPPAHEPPLKKALAEKYYSKSCVVKPKHQQGHQQQEVECFAPSQHNASSPRRISESPAVLTRHKPQLMPRQQHITLAAKVSTATVVAKTAPRTSINKEATTTRILHHSKTHNDKASFLRSQSTASEESCAHWVTTTAAVDPLKGKRGGVVKNLATTPHQQLLHRTTVRSSKKGTNEEANDEGEEEETLVDADAIVLNNDDPSSALKSGDSSAKRSGAVSRATPNSNESSARKTRPLLTTTEDLSPAHNNDAASAKSNPHRAQQKAAMLRADILATAESSDVKGKATRKRTGGDSVDSPAPRDPRTNGGLNHAGGARRRLVLPVFDDSDTDLTAVSRKQTPLLQPSPATPTNITSSATKKNSGGGFTLNATPFSSAQRKKQQQEDDRRHAMSSQKENIPPTPTVVVGGYNNVGKTMSPVARLTQLAAAVQAGAELEELLQPQTATTPQRHTTANALASASPNGPAVFVGRPIVATTPSSGATGGKRAPTKQSTTSSKTPASLRKNDTTSALIEDLFSL